MSRPFEPKLTELPDKSVRRCAFCSKPATTKDHIPPKSMFAVRRSDLITVPACAECNGGTSADDEYFRQIAMASETLQGSPDAEPVCEKIIRSFKRDSAAGLRANFLETVRPTRLWTPSGLYAGHSYVFSLDTDRLLNTATKIVKGLFYHTAGFPLPEGYGARAITIEAFLEALGSSEGGRMRHAYSHLSQQPEIEIGRGVFSYRISRPIEDQNTSTLMLTFYRTIRFMGVTGRTAERFVESRERIPRSE